MATIERSSRITPQKVLMALVLTGAAACSKAEASVLATPQPLQEVVPTEFNWFGDLKDILSHASEWGPGNSLYIELGPSSNLEQVNFFGHDSLNYFDVLQEGRPDVALTYIQGQDINGEGVFIRIQGFTTEHQIVLDHLFNQDPETLSGKAVIELEGGAIFTFRYNPEEITFTDGYTKEVSAFDGTNWEGTALFPDPIVIFENAYLESIYIPSRYGNEEMTFLIGQSFREVSFHSPDAIEILRGESK